MANKQRRQLFPEKLWDLVNKPSSGIKWSIDGKRIEVDRTHLEKFLQTKQCDRSFQCTPTSASSSTSTSTSSGSSIHQTKFRSHNFDSFIRQLHFYGFKKAGNSYYHEKFQRGQPEWLHSMKRKYSNLNFSPSSHHLECDGRISRLSKESITSRLSLSSTSFEPLQPRTSIASTKSVAAISAATISTKSSRTYATLETKMASISSSRKPATMVGDNSDKKITVYTMRPTNSIEDFSFDNIREDKVDAVCDERTIQFRLPSEISESTGKSIWPKTLVLDSFKEGNQSILSAYFIYRLN